MLERAVLLPGTTSTSAVVGTSRQQPRLLELLARGRHIESRIEPGADNSPGAAGEHDPGDQVVGVEDFSSLSDGFRPDGFYRFIHERIDFVLGVTRKRLREIATKVLEFFVESAQSIEHADVGHCQELR